MAGMPVAPISFDLSQLGLQNMLRAVAPAPQVEKPMSRAEQSAVWNAAQAQAPRPLSPGEQANIDYSNAMLASGKEWRHPDGDISSFIGMTVPAFQHRGGYQTVPSYLGDQKNHSEAEAVAAAKGTSTQYPWYPTLRDALSGEAYTHHLMETSPEFVTAQKRKR